MTFKASKLTENNSYLFRVYAENDIGRSDPATLTEPVTAKLPFDPPGPPRNLQAKEVRKNSAILKWEPPEFDGGVPITGYTIEKKRGINWIKINKKPVHECQLKMSDLTEGEKYEVRVLAENEAGVSKPCTPIEFVAEDPFKKPSPPGQPEVQEITADSAQLSWAPPTNDGGSPVTGYYVEMKKVGDSKWSPLNKDLPVAEEQFTVNGLKPETEYEFRIIAENLAGQSAPSPPSQAAKYGLYLFTFSNSCE